MVYMVIGFGVLSIILACTTAYYYAAYKDEESARERYQEVGKETVRINSEVLDLCTDLLNSLTDARCARDTYKKELDELKSLTRGKLWVGEELDKKLNHGVWCDDEED